jgi:hypothetical protein
MAIRRPAFPATSQSNEGPWHPLSSREPRGTAVIAAMLSLGSFRPDEWRARSVIDLRYSAWGRLVGPLGCIGRGVEASVPIHLGVLGRSDRRVVWHAFDRHCRASSRADRVPAARFLPLDQAKRLALRKGLEAQSVVGYGRTWSSPGYRHRPSREGGDRERAVYAHLRLAGGSCGSAVGRTSAADATASNRRAHLGGARGRRNPVDPTR